MNDRLQHTEIVQALKAIRSMLIKLESAFNAANHHSLMVLFGETAVVTTAERHFAEVIGSRLSLPELLLDQNDLPAYCTLTVNKVLLLSPAVAYAAFNLRIQHMRGEEVTERVLEYITILGREPPSTIWYFLFVYSLL